MSQRFETVIRKAAAFPFTVYKVLISPILPMACLYKPTCSEYFRKSVLRFGVIKGLLLGFSRLFRCNGWFYKGGDDDVPLRFSWEAIKTGYRKFRK